MRKANKKRDLLLHKKREQKRLRRMRMGRIYVLKRQNITGRELILAKIDNWTWGNHRSKLFEFFILKGLIPANTSYDNSVVIPTDFSFSNNYNQTIKTISNFILAINTNIGGKVTVDFSNCTKVDQHALFLLQILGLEFQNEYDRLDKRLRVLTSKVIYEVIQSRDLTVNKQLLTTGILKSTILQDDGLMPLHTLGFLKGSKDQKHYSENRKGKLVTKISAYVNECLLPFEYEFSFQGKNYLDGLISEILNNAEDHSFFGTYYVTANLWIENKPDSIGELNLSFLNFGNSFYEGFEETKNENTNMYADMEELYSIASASNSNKFTKENLFTLYALQEGMSRLKYEDESRGTGTMKFITSFLALGDYEDREKGYHPSLSILSGKTLLICNNNYKQFERDGVKFISLNKENDLRSLPDENNVKPLKFHFPGTLLAAKIYLNKDHLTKKIQQNGTGN